MMKNYRLFLRNLPPNITRIEIEEQFLDYGTIENVEVKEKDFHGSRSKFAFINIVTSDRKLNDCFRHINSLVLNEHNIHVEVAKESFLARLKREREEAAAANTCIKNSKSSSKGVNDTETATFKHERFIGSEPLLAEQTVIDERYKSSSKQKNIFKSSQHISNTVLITPVSDPSKRKNGQIHEKDQDCISRSKEKTSNVQRMDREIYVKPEISESEKKRLDSLRERKMAFKAKERVLRDALNIVDTKNRSNKIVFADNIDELESCIDENGKQKLLFEDKEDEDEDDDKDGSSWDKNDLKISGKMNDELMALQSRFGNDKRFTLDNRFIDDQEIVDEVDDEKVESSIQEMKWQMDILQNVLGEPIRMRESVDIGTKRKGGMVRYDPTENKHHEYEVTVENPSSTKNKKLKRTSTVNDPESSTPISVSKETYFTVSESLVNSLKGEEEFSLLKTFGNETSNAKDAAKQKSHEEKTFQFNFGSKNPFKYDSSDNEGDEKDVEAYTGEQRIESTTLNWHDNLFFSIDDPRFQGAEQFFSKQQISNEEFTSLRRELKQIVRTKIRKNTRKGLSWNKRRVKKRI